MFPLGPPAQGGIGEVTHSQFTAEYRVQVGGFDLLPKLNMLV